MPSHPQHPDGPHHAPMAHGAPLPAHIAAKILTRGQLLAARATARAQGRRLVQCHGCFDIVHPGHIRHLRQARSLGDMLLVSITGDPSVRKGEGRPLIPEELRAENLAALDCVDLVYIDPSPTALDLLKVSCPDVYVKGKEYEFNKDPRFAAEREAVEAAGGRVVFTSGDVVFSSTALIAALENSTDPYHQRLVELSRCADLCGPDLYAHISAFRGKRMVIVGEVILDTYILCDRPEVAGESPVMTLRPVEARHYDGGAAVVARHAASLGAHPILVTALPDSPEATALRDRLAAEGVEVRSIPVTTRIPEKQRFLVGAQKLMKLDLVEHFMLDLTQQEELVGLAREAAEECGAKADQGLCDAAVIADFGLGMLSPRSLSGLCRALRPVTRTLSGDVSGKRSSLRAMRGMDLLCPSEQELRDAMRLHSEGLPLVTWRLLEETASTAALISLGADGLIAFSRMEGGTPAAKPTTGPWKTRLHGEHVPALCPIALDPLGCGDSLLAVATLALAGGASHMAAAFLGACAAAVQVQRLGNIPITAADLRHMIARIHSTHLAFSPIEAANRGRTMARAG